MEVFSVCHETSGCLKMRYIPANWGVLMRFGCKKEVYTLQMTVLMGRMMMILRGNWGYHIFRQSCLYLGFFQHNHFFWRYVWRIISRQVFFLQDIQRPLTGKTTKNTICQWFFEDTYIIFSDFIEYIEPCRTISSCRKTHSSWIRSICSLQNGPARTPMPAEIPSRRSS